jgi:tetratricopeptide (TPR) repeat protein
LQTAAVIGTEVPLPLLQTIAELPEDALQRGLVRLQAAEFLYETQLFPEREYTYKHALTHEVAYGSLLLERRRVLHAQLVDAIEQLFPDRLAEQVERLAHHAVRGEVWDKALHYCRQAGARAAEGSAYREAAAAFEQALGALQQLPDSRATREQAIDLRFDLRNALSPLGELERVLDVLRQAEPIAEALGDCRRLGQLAGYMSACLMGLGDPDGSLASAQHALGMATALGDVGLQIAAHAYLGEVYWNRGDNRRAVEVFRKQVELLHGTPLRERFGTAPVQSVHCRAMLAFCLAELGAFAEGRAHGEDALRLAEAVEHPYSLALACELVGRLYLRQGALHQAMREYERGLALSKAAHLPDLISRCSASLGIAYALAGRVTEALPLLERALEQAVAMRGFYPRREAVWLGEAYVLAGRVAEAIPLGQQALEAARAHKQQGWEAYALRLLGEIAMHSDPLDVDEAAPHYRQALVLADKLGMRPLQAHCHRGLGTLYLKTGQQEQAQAELSTAIVLYRAMDMTFWLPETEAALA